uniref:Uncharacterized protein n=1 Tax=Arundo donax TaxID=35708 RepID=A0A0A9A617_ARUDO
MHDADLCCSGSFFHHVTKDELLSKTSLPRLPEVSHPCASLSNLTTLSLKSSNALPFISAWSSSTTAQKHDSRLEPKGVRCSCSCHFWVYL